MTPLILLVEDDISLGFVIAEQLRMEGFDVDTAIDGEDGFRRFNEKKYHLCILDVMMPKKDGYSLATDIRKINKNIPILFLTAKNMTEDKVRGFEVGGDDYLTKPFSSVELMMRVKALLKRVNIISTQDDGKIKIGRFVFDIGNYLLIDGEKVKKLTKKEVQILKVLTEFKNEVVDRNIILTAVWGKDDYFVGRSLDVFITKLRKYLSEDPKVNIENVHGVGFKLVIN